METRRGRIVPAGILLFLATAAFGADRPFMDDRNRIFEEGLNGQVRCAAVYGSLDGAARLDRRPEGIHEPNDAWCFPEQLIPWR